MRVRASGVKFTTSFCETINWGVPGSNVNKPSLFMVVNMRRDIIDCLDFGLDAPSMQEALAEKVIDFVNAEDCIFEVNKEKEDSFNRKVEILHLPLQDTFWSCSEISLKHQGLSSFRMLVLSDIGATRSLTVQFCIEKVSQVSYQDQAMQLLCQGCLHPLDGKKSRRPRFLCLNIPCYDRDIMTKECDNLGIHFRDEMLSSSKEDLSTFQQKFQNSPSYFRQCSVCGISGSPTLFDECEKCGAVLYCGERCKSEDWMESHQDWCSRFKHYMTGERELADLPFDFASETTRIDFHEQKRKEFLSQFKICDKGLSRSDCHQPSQNGGLHNNDPNYQTSQDGNCIFGLEEESSLMEVGPSPPQRSLSGWSDYYSLRGFHRNSPIAVQLHFPLTLYYVITQLLPKDFTETFATIRLSKSVCVHVIGAEKEVEMFHPFLECARLLTPLTLDVHLFGNNLHTDTDVHGQALEKENLHFKVHRGLYHKMNHLHVPPPSLAICFNGGLGAYTSYMKTIKLLMTNNTPLYYTDYGQACVAFSASTIAERKAGRVSPSVINPFRCPLRLVASDQNLPRYSNAFITHIKPFSSSDLVTHSHELMNMTLI